MLVTDQLRSCLFNSCSVHVSCLQLLQLFDPGYLINTLCIIFPYTIRSISDHANNAKLVILVVHNTSEISITSVKKNISQLVKEAVSKLVPYKMQMLLSTKCLASRFQSQPYFTSVLSWPLPKTMAVQFLIK